MNAFIKKIKAALRILFSKPEVINVTIEDNRWVKKEEIIDIFLLALADNKGGIKDAISSLK